MPRSARIKYRGIGHTDEVTPCGEVARPAVGLVFAYEVFEVTKRQKAQQLCKHRSPRVHIGNLGKRGGSTLIGKNRISNRRNRESGCKPHPTYVSVF